VNYVGTTQASLSQESHDDYKLDDHRYHGSRVRDSMTQQHAEKQESVLSLYSIEETEEEAEDQLQKVVLSSSS
jgi:hypothetical protein